MVLVEPWRCFPRPVWQVPRSFDPGRWSSRGKDYAVGMSTDQPDTILSNPRLPTLPAVAVRVLELSNEPGTHLNQLAEVIQNDQALSAKVIRTVNSSYFGLARPCADINQAIVYLGLNAVKMLALGFSLVHSVDDSEEWNVNFNYVTYWRRSMHAAAAARAIAKRTRSWDAEESFLAALLQDFGMIAYFRAYGDTYLQAIDLTEGDHSALPAIEERSFQGDHAWLGAELAGSWNMPEQISQAIRYHHTAEDAPGKWQPLARTVNLATDLAALVSETPVPDAMQRFRKHAEAWFKLGKAETDSLVRTAAENATEMSSLFNVDLGTPADVDTILMQAEEARIREHIELERDAGKSNIASHIATPTA